MISKVEPLVTIIILNWNKWQDTVECLASLSHLTYPNYRIVLVDNNSLNDSVTQIKAFLTGQRVEGIQTHFSQLVERPDMTKLQFMIQKIDNYPFDYSSFQDDSGQHLWLLLSENLGFARANNLAIAIASQLYNPDYFFLLNNDTVVEPDAVTHLVTAMTSDATIAAAQPVIYYYSNPVQIANAGGIILPWGQTRYYTKIRAHTWQKITFINGCALFLRRETIEKFGALTERFFFAEEDFEYSLRLKRQRARAICVADSKIYHKIGASEIAQNIERKVVLFAVNRLVDLKHYYVPIIWRFWASLSLLYFWGLLFFKYRVGWKKSANLISEARQWVHQVSEVDKDTVMAILRRGVQ